MKKKTRCLMPINFFNVCVLLTCNNEKKGICHKFDSQKYYSKSRPKIYIISFFSKKSRVTSAIRNIYMYNK